MARVGWVAGLALLVGACAPTSQDRVQEYNEIGIELYQKGDYLQARESFQAALALKPDDANLLFNLGQCYDHQGKADKAEQAYRSCLQSESNHVECRHALALLLWQQDRRQDTVKMVEAWLASEPKLAAAYSEHGWLWHRLGDLPRARSRLLRALELDPHDNLALTELGQIYEEMNRPDRAAYLYERALEVKPQQPEVLHRLTSLKAMGAGPPRPD